MNLTRCLNTMSVAYIYPNDNHNNSNRNDKVDVPLDHYYYYGIENKNPLRFFCSVIFKWNWASSPHRYTYKFVPDYIVVVRMYIFGRMNMHQWWCIVIIAVRSIAMTMHAVPYTFMWTTTQKS